MMSTPEQFEYNDEIYSLEPQEELPAQIRAPVQVHDVPCKQCGYDLSGLSEDGVCPECGFSIELSLAEDLLENSAPAYLKVLHLGVILILTALTIKFLSILGSIIHGFTVSYNGSTTTGNTGIFNSIESIVDFVAALITAIGWWMFSAPDPMFTGRADGSVSRKVVRITTIVNLGASILAIPLLFLALTSPSGMMLWLTIGIGVLSMIAWITGYFAGMQYLRWLSPRVPNMRVYERAKMFLWLGPLLFTVGWLCAGIGPLVGFVLYWNLFNWVREDLKSIRNHQEINYA